MATAERETTEHTALQRVENTAAQVAAFNTEAFEVAQRMAKALCTSNIVPVPYQGNIANVMVAMEYAHRIGASVLAVMQNLDVIHGRPSLRSTFLIGTVNASGRFSPIRWKFQGTEGTDDWGCRAVAIDKSTGDECVGPLITIGLAKLEGWYKKNGSKWQTIPELMLMYRSAAWWSRLFCPELSLGLHTTDEVEDLLPATSRSEAATSLNQALELVAEVQTESGEQPEKGTPEQHRAYMAAMNNAMDREAIQKKQDREDARHRWQKEHIGKESTSEWTKADYARALAMLDEAIWI